MTFSSRFGRCFLAQTGGAHHKYEFYFLFVWTLMSRVRIRQATRSIYILYADIYADSANETIIERVLCVCVECRMKRR